LARFGEAFIIASLLAALVEPFLKRRLLREASRSIFEHMLGFDLPAELREHLRNVVFNTVLYRKDVKMSLTIRPGDGRVVFIDVVQEYEIVNPGHKNMSYTPVLACVDVEKPSNCEMTYIVDGQDVTTRPFEIVSDGDGYVKGEAKKIEIEPQSKHVRYRFVSKHTHALLRLIGFRLSTMVCLQ
jgi:hypothetical protein